MAPAWLSSELRLMTCLEEVKRPRFSVVIPAKNEEASIGRCLDSIFEVEWDQTDYEVMVVDNGSSDRTAEICRSKGAKVFVKPGLTISGLRNFGASMALGEILAFIDADCTVDPGWFREASRYLDQPDVVCFGNPPDVPAGASWVQRAWYQVRKKKEPVGATDWLESMNMFLRQDVFTECGGFDEALVTCEDYDLCIRLNRIGRVVSDSRIVATHHGEAATVGHFFRKEQWRGISNMAGIKQHGITRKEIPSLLAPALHCVLTAVLIAAVLFIPADGLTAVLLITALWQMILLLRSLRAQWPDWSLNRTLQLYWLINVYLFARGIAMFHRKQQL